MHTLKKTAAFLFISCLLLSGTSLISGCSMSYNGEKLFFREGCSQCHTYKGKGGRMGPDLSAVTNLRSDSWIDSYLKNPKEMNPFSRMPSFSHLSDTKRKAIIAFLKK
jgi:cbb3-type cytochrome oxidase cytochrome c subunit